MAHTFSAKALLNDTGNDPNILAFNANASTTLLVVSIMVDSSVIRAGGDPTFDSIPMIEAGTTAAHQEGTAEIWYLVADITTGSEVDLSVPNSGTVNMSIVISTYISSTGYSEFDKVAQAEAISADPTVSITPAETAGVIVDSCFMGYRNVSSGGNRTELYKADTGSEGYGCQYYLSPPASSVAMSWTQNSDDWQIKAACFIEGSIPPIELTGTVAAISTVQAATIPSHRFSAKWSLISSPVATTAEILLTLASDVTLVVASVMNNTSGTRQGGDPTLDGETMLEAGSQADLGGEGTVEIFYLVASITTGSEITFSLPNTVAEGSGDSVISVVISSYVSSSGTSEFDTTNRTNSLLNTNPTVSVTPSELGSVIVDSLFSGYLDAPTANNRTLLYSADTGSNSMGAQYYSGAPASSTAMSWTQGEDDYQLRAAVFIVGIAAGSLVKYWTSSAWVLKPLKVYNGATWDDATLKVYNGATWDIE